MDCLEGISSTCGPIIVRRADVMPIGVAQFDILIKSVCKKILEISTSQNSLFQMTWSRNYPAGDVSKIFTNLVQKIHADEVAMGVERGNLEVLWKQIPLLPETNLIPDIFKTLQHLDISLSLLQDKCTRMKTVLQSTAFRKALEWHNRVVRDCLKAIEEKKHLSIIKLFEEVLYPTVCDREHSRLHTILQIEIRNLHVDGSIFFLQTMNHIEKQGDLNNVDWIRIKRVLEGFADPELEIMEKGLIGELEDEVGRLTPKLENGRRVLLADCDRQSFSLQSASKYESPPVLSLWLPNLQWTFNYYPEAWKSCEELQGTSKEILGLASEIKELIERNVVDGCISPEIYEKYYGLYYTFQTDIISLRGNLFGQEANILVSDMMSYAAGLLQILDGIRDSLVLLKKFCTESFQAILTSERCLFAYLLSSDGVEELYFAAKKFQKIPKQIDDSFMSQMVEVIEATLVEKGLHSLTLTKEEASVWTFITGREPMTGDSGLTPSVRAYIEKRLTRLCFFSHKKYDQRAAILIHILSTQEMYKKQWAFSLENHKKFAKIIHAYQKEIDKKSFDEASEIFFLIYKASKKCGRDRLAFAHAWQKFFEFHQASQGFNDCPEMHSLISIVYRELRAVEADQKYVTSLPEKNVYFRDKKLEMKEELLESDTLFNLHRALGASIWSSDSGAQSFLTQFLTKNFLEQNILGAQQQNDFKKLICENAIQRILCGNASLLVQYEMDVLKELSIKKYFNEKRFEMKDPRVLFVLVQLVQQDYQEIILEMISTMGEEGFTQWKRYTDQFLSGIKD